MKLVARILLACIMGCIIGYERKSRDKSAGMRTHAIVALGSALIMVVSKYCFRDVPDFDASRVAAQIVSGIGFLGAGVIFVKNNSVSGLTTAAGLWTTAGVGMAIGGGAYFIGISAAFLVIVTQIILHRISFFSEEPYRGNLTITVTTTSFNEVMDEVEKRIEEEKIRIMSLKIKKGKEDSKIEFHVLYPTGYQKNKLISSWSKDKRIIAING